jgi:hypothetical protein
MQFTMALEEREAIAAVKKLSQNVGFVFSTRKNFL